MLFRSAAASADQRWSRILSPDVMRDRHLGGMQCDTRAACVPITSRAALRTAGNGHCIHTPPQIADLEPWWLRRWTGLAVETSRSLRRKGGGPPTRKNRGTSSHEKFKRPRNQFRSQNACHGDMRHQTIPAKLPEARSSHTPHPRCSWRPRVACAVMTG